MPTDNYSVDALADLKSRFNRAVDEIMHDGPPTTDEVALRNLRKHLGWTQAELAQELGVRRSTISDHERGAAPVPRERMLAVLCLCLWALMIRPAE